MLSIGVVSLAHFIPLGLFQSSLLKKSYKFINVRIHIILDRFVLAIRIMI